jgi:hypothetical protein
MDSAADRSSIELKSTSSRAGLVPLDSLCVPRRPHIGAHPSSFGRLFSSVDRGSAWLGGHRAVMALTDDGISTWIMRCSPSPAPMPCATQSTDNLEHLVCSRGTDSILSIPQPGCATTSTWARCPCGNPCVPISAEPAACRRMSGAARAPRCCRCMLRRGFRAF